MLTQRASRLRDWTLFAALALLPAALAGALGLRALSNEEAAARREVAQSLDAATERASLDIHQALERAAEALERLEAASVEPDPTAARETLRRITPVFAEPILLARDRTLLVPPHPPAFREPEPPSCRALAERVASAGESQQDGAAKDEARREFLATCREARSPSGRWLWPVLALDAMNAGGAEDFAAWVEAHAGMLSSAEKTAAAIEARTTSALSASARDRVLRALSAAGSRRDELAAELRSEGASAALRGAGRHAGLVRWRAGGSIGVLRPLEDGRLAGFIVHRSSLAEALASGWLPGGPERRAQLVTGAQLITKRDLASRGAAVRDAGSRADGAALEATVTIAPELALRITPADPAAVARHASRSRALLAALSVGGAVLAFALASLLFARMREARRSSQLRTVFVSTVSHELRTPIASLRMLAELLEQGRVEKDELGEVYEALAREARRLGETVDRLLGFSRMAAGRYAIDRREAPVAAAVAASIDTFEERHPELPRVVRAMDEELVANIDEGQIRLAVDNLLANACKYAKGGAPFTVRVEREGSGVAIRVKDAGPGIEKRDQRRIFEPFERADDRLSRATEGSGIGLSLVRHVARAHGGDAYVESAPGRGATFTIRIPRSAR